MEMWVNEFWLFVTAIIFTIIGWYWGFKSNSLNIIDVTIDGLIENGYIKTRTNENGELEILKYNE